LTEEQVKLIPYEIQKIQKDIEATTAQIAKLEKDKLLIQEQINESKFRVQYLLPAEKSQLEAQTRKLDQEKDLVIAKTAETTKNLLVLDKQINLLQEQAAAYDKEIAVKRDKIQADSWSAKAVADGSGAGGPPSWT
jgi:chromosome segregation ATPase